MSDGGYLPQELSARVRYAAAQRGARPVAGDFARWALGAVEGLPWTLRGSRREFVLAGERYPYLHHRYKLSWLTERAVEVPVVQRIVDRHQGARILEVGNVLSHYRPQRHLVLDKYEQAPGVLNRDVLDLDGLGPFDLVVAISTLEHVGWDEEPREPAKAPAALRALRALLAPGGRLVLSHPVGYNPVFDAALRDGALEPAGTAALRRVSSGPHWRELPVTDAWSTPYDFLLYSARAVIFAFIEGGER